MRSISRSSKSPLPTDIADVAFIAFGVALIAYSLVLYPRTSLQMVLTRVNLGAGMLGCVCEVLNGWERAALPRAEVLDRTQLRVFGRYFKTFCEFLASSALLCPPSVAFASASNPVLTRHTPLSEYHLQRARYLAHSCLRARPECSCTRAFGRGSCCSLVAPTTLRPPR